MMMAGLPAFRTFSSRSSPDIQWGGGGGGVLGLRGYISLRGQSSCNLSTHLSALLEELLQARPIVLPQRGEKLEKLEKLGGQVGGKDCVELFLFFSCSLFFLLGTSGTEQWLQMATVSDCRRASSFWARNKAPHPGTKPQWP